MNKKRRRAMMEGKEPLIIFKYGDTKLSAGEWGVSSSIENGYISLASQPYEEGRYLSDGASIIRIDFSGYKKLCFRVNVPNWTATYPSWDVAIGYAASSASVYDSSTWAKRVAFGSAGTRSGEISLDAVQDGYKIAISCDGGTIEGNYAHLYVYDLWLE